jgi:2,3-bisphosphoglycerate-independent phosphoglycerate mutase
MKNKNIKANINVLPLILVILDGWGISEPNKGNAVTMASTPTMDGLVKKYPYTELCAHGKCVGLPPKQVGNSEAGHMNIGAGRIVEQDVVRISRSISNGTFFRNTAFLEAAKHAQKNKSNLHLMGMLSNGQSPHSDPDHLIALIEFAKRMGIKNVYLHIITDGRDSPKYAAIKLIQNLRKIFKNGECIATIMGRFYAMDRKKKWIRTEKAYNALVLGEGEICEDAEEAITEAYNKDLSDEFIEPSIIKPPKCKISPRIDNNDSVIFFNLRSDRARQLSKVFVQKDFTSQNPGSFKRKKVLKNLLFVAMTDFGPDLDSILSAFPSLDLKNTLPMILPDLTQLYLAETEKYAHVTYFFNGGYSGKVNGEVQLMIESPDVRSYDQTPPMKSKELSELVIKNLGNSKNWQYDFTLLNLAAPDMVGHTGNLEAGISCCHLVDHYLGDVIKAYLAQKGTVVVTADHGNVEEMIKLKTGEIDTEHSINKVPFLIVNKQLSKKVKLRDNACLSDIAPTILELLGREKPKEMTGKSILI